MRSITFSVMFHRKAVDGSGDDDGSNFKNSILKTTPDWSESAVDGDHLWSHTKESFDVCYVGDQECKVREKDKNIT